jgi:uncharacterized protein
MLIRFVLENVYSFLESKEFNMFARPKIRTPEGHKYSLNGLDLLKLSAIYGANAAGKSNLIKALALLQSLLKGEVSSNVVYESRFKFESSKSSTQSLTVEFLQEGKPFYYAISFDNGLISLEELYRSGLGKKEDELLFERKKALDGSNQLSFSTNFEKDPKSQTLKAIVIEEFLDDSKPVLPWLANRNNSHLNEVKTAMRWFEQTLQIIMPATKPLGITAHLDKDPQFNKFAHDTLCAYGLGISKLWVETKSIEEFFGVENEAYLAAIRDKFAGNKRDILLLNKPNGDEIVVEKENGKLVAKHLRITQEDFVGQEAEFDIDELSDGTIRLLDFLPAFQDVVLKPKVYVVDEIERSMHPNLAKELVKKFSHDPNTLGQLIFSTHESNLLDLSIFRQDEIWFAEKGPDRSTDLYSLSDYKEHNTTDIRKGYLNGRYGAVPFLSNLRELNWHEYATL